MVRANLKACLALRSMKQFQLADLVGITESRLSLIIAGCVHPDRALQARIAEVLRADEEWLFTEIVRVPPAQGAGTTDTRSDGK